MTSIEQAVLRERAYRVIEADSTTPGAAAGKKSGRLLSLDLVRGLTIVGMIIVNATAAFEVVMPNVFPVLLHAKWAGFNAADAVFPAFITIVGISIAISTKPGQARGTSTRKILWRAVRLILLGLFLANMYLLWAPTKLWPPRLTGVLQRIGLVYAVVAFMYPRTSLRTRVLAAAALLLGYWGICRLPLPDGSAADLLSRGQNFPSWFDRLVSGSWICVKGPNGYDPEGFLSTLPVIAQAIMGTIAGDFLRRNLPVRELSWGFAAAGVLSAALGLAWNPLFPIAKPIWTSSFVLVSTGIVMVALGAFHYLFDRGDTAVAKGGLFGSFGRNSIAAYSLHLLVIQLMMAPFMRAISRYAGRFSTPEIGALAPVAIFLALIWLPLSFMDRRGVYWRI
jgi:predicted acyltransferase